MNHAPQSLAHSDSSRSRRGRSTACLDGALAKSAGQRRSPWLAVAASFAPVVVVLVQPGVHSSSGLHAAHVEHYFTWIQSGNFSNIGFDFMVDQPHAVMLLVVTGVGLLIHIYSIGYMAHEGGYYRFFAYLNLFMFFMLVLVLARNFLLMFVGWEGVGLCSLPADRLLLPEEVRHRRRQQSVHRQPHRRLRLPARRCS